MYAGPSRSGFWQIQHRAIITLLFHENEAAFMLAVQERKMASFIDAQSEQLKEFYRYLDLLPKETIETAIADIRALSDSSPIWDEVFEYYDHARRPGGFSEDGPDWSKIN